MWEKGYTPQQVYDLLFPIDPRFLCNPQPPAMCGRFGLLNDRLWRFEFVVGKDEDPMEMCTPAKIKSVVFPYITHPGRRYGLSNDIQFPENCITFYTMQTIGFAARSCNKWVLGKVLLCSARFPAFWRPGNRFWVSRLFCFSLEADCGLQTELYKS